MAYTRNDYQDAEQPMQNYDENQEQQYPVNTFVDSEFQDQDQDQTLNHGLSHGDHTSPNVAGCNIDGTTYYGIQQNCPVYNNGLLAQTSQGLLQNRKMIVPVQIQGNNFDHQQIFNPFRIFQTQNYNVQSIQSYITPYRDVQQTTTFIPPPHQAVQQTSTIIPSHQAVQQTSTIIPPHQGAQQTSTIIPHHQAVQQTSTIIPPHQGAQQTSTIIPHHQAVQQISTFIPPHQGAQQTTTLIPPPHQAVQQTGTIISPHQAVQQTSTIIPPHQDAQQTSAFIPPYQGAQQTSMFIPPHQAVQQISTFIPPYQAVQTSTFIPPHQTAQQTSTFIPPYQAAQETTLSNTSNGDTVHQTQHYGYKPWYCSEFIHKKDDDKEVSDYHKPITEIIVEKKSQGPVPEVVQDEQVLDEAGGKTVFTSDAATTSDYSDYHKPITEIIVEKSCQASVPEVVHEEQILDEAGGKTVSTPDAATTSDYSENLWELICKFCPAESSVSSLLACHICDMSLVESENKENIICNTCFSRLPCGMTLKRHKETRRHLLLLLNYKGDTKIDELQFFYCSTCRFQCNNYAAYIKHLLSQKHIEFEECLSFNLYYCSKCKLMMDGTAYEVHVSSKTHLLNCMISNTRLFCLTSKLDVSNLNCTICKEKFVNGKSYNTHLYSVKHCSNLLELKLKDDFSHSKQYVFFNNNKYVCVLCKINIGDKTSLIYHFLTDEHMSHEVSFQKIQYEKFVSGDYHLTSHFKEQYLNCSECKTLKRDCEHMFKNANEYKAWKEKIEKGKYCIYCNCFSDQSHESTELHKKVKGAVNYCRLCDKVLTIDIVKHEQGTRHRRTIKKFGTGGVERKRGPSKMFCGVCDLTSETEEHHLQHLAGLNHRTQYNAKCIENRFHCNLCTFTVTELYKYEEHEKSTGHVEKLNKVDTQFNRFKFCFICRQPVTNGTLSEHNETVQHLDAIKMI